MDIEEKKKRRQEALEQQIKGSKFREDAVPLIKEIFDLWDRARYDSDKFSIDEIASFEEEIRNIWFRSEQFISENIGAKDTDDQVFAGQWIKQYLTEAGNSMTSLVSRELSILSAKCNALTRVIQGFMHEGFDTYEQYGKVFNNCKMDVSDLVGQFRRLKGIRAGLSIVSSGGPDFETEQKRIIIPLTEAMSEFRDDYYKYSEHIASMKTLTISKITCRLLILTAFITAVSLFGVIAGLYIDYSALNKENEVTVKFQEGHTPSFTVLTNVTGATVRPDALLEDASSQ